MLRHLQREGDCMRSKVLFALSKDVAKTTMQISEETGLPFTKVGTALDSLVDEGLAGEIDRTMVHPCRYYRTDKSCLA